jgi:UDP-3-O-[3-hydroxymyristoyl] glucosamine N-acyltransferase
MRDVPAGTDVLGSPAVPVKDAMRGFTIMKRLVEESRQSPEKRPEKGDE